MEFIRKLKDFRKGDRLKADDLNNMVGAIREIVRGDHISTLGILKSVSGGKVTLKMPPEPNKGGGGTGYVCAGFIVECDAGTGAVSQTVSSVSYGGGYDSAYVLTYATGTAPNPGDRIVQAKFEYTADDETAYGTNWTLDDVTFELVTALSTDTTPAWDDATANEWDPVSGVHYSPWATISDRVVTSSFGGGIILQICRPGEITVVHGCVADL